MAGAATATDKKNDELTILITDNDSVNKDGYDGVIQLRKGESEQEVRSEVWKYMADKFEGHITITDIGPAINGIDDYVHYTSDKALHLVMDQYTPVTVTAALEASDFCAYNGVEIRAPFIERERQLTQLREQQTQESSGKEATSERKNVAAFLKEERAKLEKSDNHESYTPITEQNPRRKNVAELNEIDHNENALNKKDDELKILITNNDAANKDGYDGVIQVLEGESEQAIRSQVWYYMTDKFEDHITTTDFGPAINGVDEDCIHYTSDKALHLDMDQYTPTTVTAALEASDFCAYYGVENRMPLIERERQLTQSIEQRAQGSSGKEATPKRKNVAMLLKAEREKLEKPDNHESHAPVAEQNQGRRNVAELLKNERARNAEKAKVTPSTPSAKDEMTI